MFVEMRRNNQVIVPKRIAFDLGLKEGDHLEVSAVDGVIVFTPVVVKRRVQGEGDAASRGDA